MGIKGTEVTKEAAGMILADDNFASIGAAVKEGRTVYNNIEKAILFLFPTNVAQALVIAVAIFLGFTLPITAPQVLWVNMVTSVALGLVLCFEPHELDVMIRPPRAVDRPILTGFGIWRVIFVGLALLAVTLWAFFWMKSQNASDQLARTVAVNMITIGQIFYLLNSRYLLDSLAVFQGASWQQVPAPRHWRGHNPAAPLHLCASATGFVRQRSDPALGLATPLPGRPDFLPRRGGGEDDYPFVGLLAEFRDRGGSGGVRDAGLVATSCSWFGRTSPRTRWLESKFKYLSVRHFR